MREAMSPSLPEAVPAKPSRFTGWAIEPFLGKTTRGMAVAAMLVSIVMPVNGLGFDVCVLHRMTGLPCPGCGLTRGVAAMTHGDVFTAVALNPFSVIIWAVFAILTLTVILPRRQREGLLAFARNHSLFFGRFYKLSVISFLVFGTARLMIFFVTGDPFP